MNISQEQLQDIIEGALFAVGQPLTIDRVLQLFEEEDAPSREEIKAAFEFLMENNNHKNLTLKELATGFQYQVNNELSPWIRRLWEEKPARYSRAFYETLALIAYRQPVTRAEIEDVRGVAVSTNIIKTMLEREWVKVIGHRDVPGKPAIYGTTKYFLEYFNLKTLSELPTLLELQDLDEAEAQLENAVESEEQRQQQLPIAEALVDENGAELDIEEKPVADAIDIDNATDILFDGDELVALESEFTAIEQDLEITVSVEKDDEAIDELDT